MLRNIEKRVPAGFRQENKKSFRVYLTQAEGYVAGLGAKLFIIAGPVIVYGVTASVVFGAVLWILHMFGITLF